jgi:hypothetical protein
MCTFGLYRPDLLIESRELIGDNLFLRFRESALDLRSARLISILRLTLPVLHLFWFLDSGFGDALWNSTESWMGQIKLSFITSPKLCNLV